MQPCFSSIDHDDKLIAVHGLAGLVGGTDPAELLDSPGIVVNYRERKSKTVNLQALTTEKKVAKTMLPLTSVSLCLRIAPPRTLHLRGVGTEYCTGKELPFYFGVSKSRIIKLL